MAVLEVSPIVCNPNVCTLGFSAVFSFEVRSTAGVLTTPGTSSTIQVTGPRGTVVQAYTAATLGASAGLYTYVFAAAITETPGKYSVGVKVVDGGVTSGNRADFILELVLSS